MSYTSVRDMFDGGGAGTSGDKFKGPLNVTRVANAVGVKPVGSNTIKDADGNDTGIPRPKARPTYSPTGSNGGSNALSRASGGSGSGGNSSLPKTVAPPPVKSFSETQKDTDVAALSKAATKGGVDPTAVFDDASAFINGDMTMGDQVPNIDQKAYGTNISGKKYRGDADGMAVDAATAKAKEAAQVEAQDAQGYEADTATDEVSTDGQSTAAQGEVSDQAQMEAQQIDEKGAATGINKDGTTNEFGKALNDWARQDISNLIDTSTVSGKLLANELGEGNYTDTKATVQGQMEILSKQFVDQDGNPKIPSWAAGVARNVSKIAAFKGMTGTAATAAMSQAILEASLPMAQQDAQFFQTVTMQNLNNRQQQTVQKASVLANIEMANLDARTQAAVVNAQAFLQMDMANLQNEQQSEIVNTQSRVQAMLEDSRAVNAARAFGAQADNDFTKFYDQLNSQIDQFTVAQKNGMRQFNASEKNSVAQFNSQLESQREQFYKEMQYNVDLSNAKWRQTVELAETQMQFDAAKLDVQNMFGLTAEAMTRMWDREDQNLGFAWKSAESKLDREFETYMAERGFEFDEKKLKSEEDAAFGAALFEGAKWLAGPDFGLF